jgi:hypothetical protein
MRSFEKTNKIIVKTVHVSDEALLEDSSEILAAVQETTSNLPPTTSRDNYVKC